MNIAVIYGGTRKSGNTEWLTKQVINGVKVKEFHLSNYQINAIKDHRHSEGGFPLVDDDYQQLIQEIMTYETLIFATPIYWYSMSGMMKNFIDRWSQTLRDPEMKHFKKCMENKQAYVIAVGGDQPTIKGLPMIQQFQYIFDFIGMKFLGYILGEGNKPRDIEKDTKAISAAKEMNKVISQGNEA